MFTHAPPKPALSRFRLARGAYARAPGSGGARRADGLARGRAAHRSADNSGSDCAKPGLSGALSRHKVFNWSMVGRRTPLAPADRCTCMCTSAGSASRARSNLLALGRRYGACVGPVCTRRQTEFTC
jgi:hypothetical protein